MVNSHGLENADKAEFAGRCRGLGNGSYHRQGTGEYYTDLVRVLKKLPLYGRLLQGKNLGKVADMAIRLLFPYRKNVQTITTYNGSKFACHKKIAKALGTTVYFADSYASLQKKSLRTKTNLSGNTYRKERTSGNSRMSSSRRFSTKLTEGQRKN